MARASPRHRYAARRDFSDRHGVPRIGHTGRSARIAADLNAGPFADRLSRLMPVALAARRTRYSEILEMLTRAARRFLARSAATSAWRTFPLSGCCAWRSKTLARRCFAIRSSTMCCSIRHRNSALPFRAHGMMLIAHVPLAQGRLAEHPALSRDRGPARCDGSAGNGAEVVAGPGQGGGNSEGRQGRQPAGRDLALSSNSYVERCGPRRSSRALPEEPTNSR